MNFKGANLLLGLVFCILAAAVVTLFIRVKSDRSVATMVSGEPLTNLMVSSKPAGLTKSVIRVNWANLHSTNYQQFIANLRAFGCPEMTIRDIVIMDVAKVYARKRSEARRQGKPYEYWREQRHGDHAIERQLALLEREQHKIVRDLLGIELISERARYWDDEELDFNFLPEGKQQRLAELLTRYEAKEDEIYSRTQGHLQPKDEQELQVLAAQRRKEFDALLTSEEREQYDLRYSVTAQTVRGHLSGIDPSEEEFLRLYRVYKKYENSMSEGMATSQATGDQFRTPEREAAERAFQKDVREALGESRFAELQRANDPAYEALVHVAQRYNLSTDIPGEAYNLKVEAERKKYEVESDPRLTSEQRAAALSVIARDAETALTRKLGADVYRAYETVGGDWIAGLRHREFQSNFAQ